MPQYEYVCNKCNWKGDLIISTSMRDSQSCPACNSSLLKRKISKSSFILKGSCWAKDGYIRK